MNLGHRLRIAEAVELRREITELRQLLVEWAPDEIDLRGLDRREGASRAESAALSS